ncbi:SPOSA6832_02825, partial [Sporobolomyces salmonicolor]
THLLPPNLLKLFAPRPPLPYLKPTGRDPDLPLKSLSAQRAPQPIRLANTLAFIQAERDERERKAIGEGRRPDQADADKSAGDEPAKSADGDVEMADPAEEKDAAAEVKPKGELGGDGAPPAEDGEEKEEGEEPEVKPAVRDEKPKDAAAATTNGTDAKKSEVAPLDAEGEALVLTEEEKFQARRRERQRRREEAMSKQYDPSADEEICGDPYKTLFVGRLPLDVTEKELLREFEIYGPLERVRLVTDPKTGKSKGYAFLVYERERDMKGAFVLPLSLSRCSRSRSRTLR